MIGRLTNLWIEQLKSLHSLELQMAKILPSMAAAAVNHEVREFLLHHRSRAKAHRAMIARILGEMEEAPSQLPCASVERLLSGWRSGDGDVHMLRTLRRAVHEEIARLAKAVNGARVLGYDDLADLLSSAMEEEQYEDAALAKLGRSIHEGVRRFLAA